jgi:Zn-dependent peptidase ImmA (M78 family)
VKEVGTNAIPDDCDGLWSDDDRTIYLRRSLSIHRKRYILTHEFLHAVADWQHWCLGVKVADHWQKEG